jgi:transcriptional regulator GlxA family with amidase domain
VAIEGEAASRSLAQGIWKDLDARSPLNRQVHHIKSLLHLLFASLNIADQPAFPHQLLRAMEAIRKHLYKPLSVEDLARLAGYSPEHLAHLFRKHVKQSPSACIREHRIREAARRLAYTDDTIEVIADDLCFANRHHMSRLFKSIMKEAPATFRKRFMTPLIK